MINLNELPVATWNRLNVNRASNKGTMPEVPEGGWGDADVTLLRVPEGVEVNDDMPIACEELVSGMGAGADRLIADNANANWNITAEGVTADPVVILSECSADSAAVVLGNIYAVEGAGITVLHVFRGNEGISESLTRVYAEKNAVVRIVEVQLMGDVAKHWSGVAGSCEAGARIEYTRIELGGSVSVCGSRVVLTDKGSAYDMLGAYFGENEDYLDYNDISEHVGRDTLCEMHSAGALSGAADKILRGTVDFKRGAKRGIGHESDDVILLSPKVRNRTAPLILCGEEEVEGQHAASAGRLDEAVLYYLNTRGIPEAEARRMMVEAKFAPAIDRVPDEKLREEIKTVLAEKLGVRS